ncbi:ABC transporter ATP-binding protein [Desulfobacterales bacterium HSG16]|nr:ABC transporter ATP-binding protein [Desulfobacterales bacterium HSG16]
MSDMTQLLDVTVVYGKKKNRVVPLKNVDFSLEKSEFVTVTGRSGSGKTTFVQVCGGLLTPTTGQVLFEKADLYKVNDTRLSEIRNRAIGFVFQSFNLIEYLTASENVALPLLFRKIPADERMEKAYEMLKSMNLDHRASHYPSELSGGECQRVAIARALITDPTLIIADEPTGNLDYETGKTVMDIFSKISAEKKAAILLVTHNPWVAKVGTRSIRIEKGRLV